MKPQNRTIIFDAINIKRGGGVTVAERILRGCVDAGWTVYVVIASAETAELLSDNSRPNLKILLKPELERVEKGVLFRHFGFSRLARQLGCDSIFSFNFWTPVGLPQITYHINVMPFMKRSETVATVGRIRSLLHPFYSRLALKRSNINMFESNHILEVAKASYQGDISNPEVRYIGIDIPKNIGPAKVIRPNLISITSGGAHKRNDLLIALHKELHARGIRLGLVIGGFGKEKAIRGTLSAADNAYLDTREDIRFLGYCSREELYKELSQALALVSFSQLESFFMVPVEAMAVGCPTITTNVSSILESVGNAGLIIPPNDIEAAVNSVMSLLVPETRQKWSQAALKWSRNFEAEHCSRLIVESIAKLPQPR